MLAVGVKNKVTLADHLPLKKVSLANFKNYFLNLSNKLSILSLDFCAENRLFNEFGAFL